MVQKQGKALAVELASALDEIDREFDDMSRQKARSDILDKKFDQLDVNLDRYERLFRIFSEVIGERSLPARFQAKRLRIDGAHHTTRGDMLWDELAYDKAMEEYSAAIKVLGDCGQRARVLEDQRLIGSCVNNMGYAEASRGDLDAGLRHFNEALSIADRRKDEVYQGLYSLNLGNFLLSTGKPEESLRYLLQSTEFNRKTGRKTWEANTLQSLGAAKLQLGRAQEAWDYLQRAMKTSEEANDRRSHGRISYILSLTATRMGRSAEGLRFMEETLQWYQRNEEVYTKAEQTVVRYQALVFLADVYKSSGNLEKSRLYAEQLAELQKKDSRRLTAYLLDPHLSPSRWRDFKANR